MARYFNNRFLMTSFRFFPAFALRQAVLLLLSAVILGLAANQINPRGILIGRDAPDLPGRSDLDAWMANDAAETPRPITLQPLLGLIQRSACLIIDARNPEAFLAGHLPGAVNLPWERYFEYVERMHALPRDRWLVLYCDGGTCDYSQLLAQELVMLGFTKVAVYSGGIEEWQISNRLEYGGEEGEE